ncbi:MAG: glycosyltransferase [Bacteroidaceae bacterium]|nr:glycosyltransferase [Bacteroidaceae bacterium]
MFLSIIIPHYNLPRELLERCIASIVRLNIEAGSYEIIVVDDGSPEPPRWVEDSFPGTEIRLITAAHGGPGAARNRGIDEAKGTYIEFVDADDTLIADESYKVCLDKLRSERPDILHFRYQVVTSSKDISPKNTAVTNFSNTISGAMYMKRFNLSGSPCCYFFRRELVIKRDIRFPENIFHEDEEFNTILHYHAGALVYCDAVLYNYCIREGSTTANSSKDFEEKRIEDTLHIIERLSDFRNAQKECSNIQAKGFEHKFTMLCVDAIRNMLYIGMSARAIHGKCRERLAPLGAYPLPAASYSMKYRIFRLLANSKCGMRILRLVTPSHKPKKR